MSYKIYANLPCFGQSGWEVLCRDILIAMDKMGFEISLAPKREWNNERVALDEDVFNRLMRMSNTKFDNLTCDLHLLHQYPTVEYLRSALYKNSIAKKVCVSLFETDRCPNAWIGLLNAMNEVWTFSEFNKIGWEKSGVKNVKVIPFNIDSKIFNPEVPPIEVQGRKKFAFIANGDATERKWFEGLIEAFVTEFKADEDVCLIIKAHEGGFINRNKRRLAERFRNIADYFCKNSQPTFLYIGDKVPCKDIGKFYTAGDCYVLASRGEGLGLPYAEAMACGIPVISTRWGGQLEFLNDDNAYLVNCDVRVIDDMEYIKKCLWALNNSWASPHVQHLRETMRWVYTFNDLAKQKAMKASEEIRCKYNMNNLSLALTKRISELVGEVKI